MTLLEPRAPATSSCSFGPVEVQWDERVLAPRAWTIEQSRWAADLARALPPGPVLELCAGAGHIGLAAALWAGRALVQVESDAVAAAYAAENARRADLADRVEVRRADLEDALRADERFALVLADPPYLTSEDVGRFPDDPVHAVDGGEDGLGVVATALAVAGRHLAPGGAVVLQVGGPAQAAAVADRLAGPAGLVVEARRVVAPDRALVHLVAR